MRNNAEYIFNPNDVRPTFIKKSFYKKIFSVFASFLFVFLTVASVAGVSSNNVVKADNLTPDEWIICNHFKNDTMAMAFLKLTHTSDLWFFTDSKSSVNGGMEKVEEGPMAMNQMLSWSSGIDYKKTNEDILGRTIDPNSSDANVNKAKFNGGNKVNPFDRFGVAGMAFTSYRGEWKYVVVDPCSGGEPTDPKLSMFYDNRLPPRSVWEDIPSSKDVRTKQFNNPIILHIWFSYVNTFANWTFGITKFIVVMVITLINLSFTNISNLLGINSFLAGDGSSGSLFKDLYENIYLPFMVVAFAFTGMYMMYQVVFKKAYRESLTTLARSLGMLFLGTIILVKPLYFINIPNDATVLLQSVLASSMNKGIAGGNGLCATDMGIKTQNILDKNLGNDLKENASILDQAAKNMKSSIGCSLWQQFLLKPYTEAQFGEDWNKLWAKGKTPSWAPEGAATINNSDNNSKMVGDATVPLGGGSNVNNWAIFQISTLTDAHNPYGKDGEYALYTNGVANDWWRIADALSNYEEQQVKSGDKSYPAPVENSVDQSWDNWNGNNQLNRWLTANASVFVAAVGLIAPLYFAALCALYGLGISLILAFTPIMLLAACFPGRGWNIFSEWGKLLLSAVVRKIISGFMLILSITFVATFIQIMEKENWWLGISLLALFSIFLVRSKNKIFDAFLSASNLMQSSFSGSANTVSGKITGTVKKSGGIIKKTGQVGASATIGGIASTRKGGTFAAGAKAGTRSELRMIGARNKIVRSGMIEYDRMKQVKNVNSLLNEGERENSFAPDKKTRCASCGRSITTSSTAYFDGANWYHPECGEREMSVTGDDFELIDIMSQSEIDEAQKNAPQAINVWKEKASLPATVQLVDEVKKVSSKKERGENLTPQEKDVLTSKDLIARRMELFKKTLAETGEFIAATASIKRTTPRIRVDDLPKEIKPYLNMPQINQLANDRNYDALQEFIMYAWINWYQDNTKDNVFANLSENEIRKEIKNSRDMAFAKQEEERIKREQQESEKYMRSIYDEFSPYMEDMSNEKLEIEEWIEKQNNNNGNESHDGEDEDPNKA